MKRIIVRIIGGLLVTTAIFALLFFIFFFVNPLNIIDVNSLNWVPLLIIFISTYFGGVLTRDIKIHYSLVLLLPIILLHPFNYLYFPFVIYAILFAGLALLLSRKQMTRKYKTISGVLAGLFLSFFLFSQPLKIAVKNSENHKIIWGSEIPSKQIMPEHKLLALND